MPLSQPPEYPSARATDVVDDCFGVRVGDPYRWLEDADSPETLVWVEAQNALTRSVLAGARRERIAERLTRLFNYPRTGVPFERGGRYFFTHNTGLQNQPILYVQDEADARPRVLLDPNALSPDGTVALTALSVSEDGSLLAYALSKSGSDWQGIAIREIASGHDLPDVVGWLKFASIAWVHDGSGF